MGDNGEITKCNKNQNTQKNNKITETQSETTKIRPRNKNNENIILRFQNQVEDDDEEENTMYNLQYAPMNQKSQLYNQYQSKKKFLEKGDKYIQNQFEQEEEEISDYEDQLKAEKYDYIKYIQSIKNDPNSRIKKTIRLKHFKNKVVEGKEPKRLPLPDDIAVNNSYIYQNQPKLVQFDEKRDKQYIYYTSYLEQNKARPLNKDLQHNKMVIDKKSQFKKMIKNSKKIIQNIIFIAIIEEVVLYGSNQDIQTFLHSIKDYENAPAFQRVQSKEYILNFDMFFNVINNFITKIENNIASNELNKQEILSQNLLEQAVLHSCLINRKEIQMVVDNYILKKDQLYFLERNFTEINEVENLLTSKQNLKKYMLTINQVLQQFDMKISVTHNTQKGKTKVKILIENNIDNEEDIFLLYDDRLATRLTTGLPKQQAQINNAAAPSQVQNPLPQEHQLFMTEWNTQGNTIPKGNRRGKQNQQQQEERDQSIRVQDSAEPSSRDLESGQQQVNTQNQNNALYNPNSIVKTSCCEKQLQIKSLLYVSQCKHYLCKQCLIDPFKYSASSCLSKNCQVSISDNQLISFLGDLEQTFYIKCSNCNSNELLRPLKYKITAKPPINFFKSSQAQEICKNCKDKKETELFKNRCPVCRACDLTTVKKWQYQQCKNCKYLWCEKCNKIIDRQQKSQEYCKCRCMQCLNIKKNESQDEQSNHHSFCQDCDETCCICRIQRRKENAFYCKKCKLFACIPCIFKITSIKTSNSKLLEKCTHFMKHYQLMEQSQLPKIEIALMNVRSKDK